MQKFEIQYVGLFNKRDTENSINSDLLGTIILAGEFLLFVVPETKFLFSKSYTVSHNVLLIFVLRLLIIVIFQNWNK